MFRDNELLNDGDGATTGSHSHMMKYYRSVQTDGSVVHYTSPP